MEGSDVENNITKGYEKATYSNIDPDRLKALKDLYDKSLLEFKSEENKEQNYLGIPKNSSPELAALTVVANAIMNLDEFLSKA